MVGITNTLQYILMSVIGAGGGSATYIAIVDNR